MRGEDQTRAKQYRERIFTLDVHMVLALTHCPTCRKKPGDTCAVFREFPLVHGERLNRAWNIAGLGKPFKVERFYTTGNIGYEYGYEYEGCWVEVMPKSTIDGANRLYKPTGQLRKHRKPRRRRRG